MKALASTAGMLSPPATLSTAQALSLQEAHLTSLSVLSLPLTACFLHRAAV